MKKQEREAASLVCSIVQGTNAGMHGSLTDGLVVVVCFCCSRPL